MRYLKRFNEALERDVDGDFTATTLDEIKDYCELNLAYLVDSDDLMIECFNVIDDSGKFECQVVLSFGSIPTPTILDQVIPFLKRIKNDYQLGTFYSYHDDHFRFHCGDGIYHISYDELDNIENMIMSKPSVKRNIEAGFDIKIEEISFFIIDEK
jgi:hypothetical protein